MGSPLLHLFSGGNLPTRYYNFLGLQSLPTELASSYTGAGEKTGYDGDATLRVVGAGSPLLKDIDPNTLRARGLPIFPDTETLLAPSEAHDWETKHNCTTEQIVDSKMGVVTRLTSTTEASSVYIGHDVDWEAGETYQLSFCAKGEDVQFSPWNFLMEGEALSSRRAIVYYGNMWMESGDTEYANYQIQRLQHGWHRFSCSFTPAGTGTSEIRIRNAVAGAVGNTTLFGPINVIKADYLVPIITREVGGTSGTEVLDIVDAMTQGTDFSFLIEYEPSPWVTSGVVADAEGTAFQIINENTGDPVIVETVATEVGNSLDVEATHRGGVFAYIGTVSDDDNNHFHGKRLGPDNPNGTVDSNVHVKTPDLLYSYFKLLVSQPGWIRRVKIWQPGLSSAKAVAKLNQLPAIERTKPKLHVVVTDDDIGDEAYTHLLPILSNDRTAMVNDLGMADPGAYDAIPGCVAVITDNMDAGGNLTWANLTTLVDTYGWEAMSHGADHDDPRTDEDWADNVADGVAALRARGFAVNNHVYLFNYWSQGLEDQLVTLGLRSGVRSVSGYNQTNSIPFENIYSLGRYVLQGPSSSYGVDGDVLDDDLPGWKALFDRSLESTQNNDKSDFFVLSLHAWTDEFKTVDNMQVLADLIAYIQSKDEYTDGEIVFSTMQDAMTDIALYTAPTLTDEQTEKGVELTDTYDNDDDWGTSKTVSDLAIGAEAADRLVVIAMSARSPYDQSAMTATIGGVEATVTLQKSTDATNQFHAVIIQAVVPTGTTADLVLSNLADGPGVNWMMLDVFRFTGLAVLHDSGGANGIAAMTKTLPTVDGGFALAVGASNVTGPSALWTPGQLTQIVDRNETTHDDTHSVGGRFTSDPFTDCDVTMVGAGTTYAAMVAASLAPTGTAAPSAAASYIAAVRSEGATVTDAQADAIAAFFDAGWMSDYDIKRFYLPIWGLLRPNAVDLVTLASGRYESSPTHGAGWIQQTDTDDAFSFEATPTELGMTVSAAGFGTLVYTADNVPAGHRYFMGSYNGTEQCLVMRGQGGADLTQGTFCRINSALGRLDLSLTRANTVGIFDWSRLSGENRCVQRLTSGPVTTEETEADYGTLPTVDIWAIAANNGGSVLGAVNAKLGAYWAHRGLSEADSLAFTLAVKDLWETCTGLTLP